MCGIVGALAKRNITPILLEGLKRLEYRGYDSAGLCVLDHGSFERIRTVGKVNELVSAVDEKNPDSDIGIAHTRWATHGKPSESNAHPHICYREVAIVHNGIIENHLELKALQEEKEYRFTSATDTEVVVHQIHHYLESGQSLLESVKSTTNDLRGAYALGVIAVNHPGRMIAARKGSPLVIGVGDGEYFIASDQLALLSVTQRFIYLQDGDIAEISSDGIYIEDEAGDEVKRPMVVSETEADTADKGEYRHFMLKEIYEQPTALAETLESRVSNDRLLEESFGIDAASIFDKTRSIRIVACGTSFHAGLVARNWFEGLANVPCRVEVASEFRYRHPVAEKDSLVVAISQSGETADTLAAVRSAKERGFGPVLSIVNVAESSLVRESDLVLMTRAGPEIGVASTKAFTTQLVALLLLVLAIGRRNGLTESREAEIVRQLRTLPRYCEEVLKLDKQIEVLSEHFADKQHALFLGRGVQYPVAMEGALKLKEISYIHAEAYPAGELKHGPLALVDSSMPVIAVAPNDELLEKLKSNLQEVQARGGELYIFADEEAGVESSPTIHVTKVAKVGEHVTPILYTIPLQLLAYHVAVIRGTDVDQPRNLAKSVTVE
ncbi:MAG: glutamine--fructose-6-phosphate transaminase (isomerizing) [Gammaproteobacteria bacterium]|nr:MAG: glutamine--fructose-6-phosphate transaminase (isomerizing) [Gammaproteobacteria bacterium]